MRVILFFSLLFICSCKTNSIIEKNKSCAKYDAILREFASNLTPIQGSGCYKYNFNTDSTKYTEYSKLVGTKFLDYRLYEIVYFNSILLNRYGTEPENIKCFKNYSKKDMLSVFGTPTSVNKYDNTLNYEIFTTKKCKTCFQNTEESDREWCGNFIRISFDESGSMTNLAIHIYSL